MLSFSKVMHSTCFLMSRTVYMVCCCGCCSALRPRYKRLVDNIFPANPLDGLDKSNMEKLMFYALSSPEKLDRIGEYLFQRAVPHIYRRRIAYVMIVMEAMDQLLLACHSQTQTLNLFVESYLKTIQKLLESTDADLQILATQSFVAFSNIEEDTPSYHRRYDFFVSKYSALCHSGREPAAARAELRLAGVQGLQGVIRKTVSDDLVENIWDAQHMDKIVPSLLYNMQSSEKPPLTAAGAGAGAAGAVPAAAELCLRELVGRASFGHIPAILKPVLTHLDRHELWIPSDFAVHVFKIIMHSIQPAYSYSVVEALMAHLEAAGGGAGAVRAARGTVLAHIVAIAATGSVGPSVLEIINNLLTYLRASVCRDSERESDEKLYQEALINALGEFADHLPDFQKIDIMMFIVSNIPSARRRRPDRLLQGILLKSLLKVGSTYKTREYSKAFPSVFLESLLRLCAGEAAPRALAHRILHALLDRRGNAPALDAPRMDYSQLGLTVEKCSRQDLIFIHKHGYAIYSSLYDGLQLESNTLENTTAVFTSMALIICELASEESLPEMLQFILSIQQSALSNPVVGRAQQCHLHAIACAWLALVAHVMELDRLREYADSLAAARAEDAPHLLPPLLAEYADHAPPAKTPHVLIDQMHVCECVRAAGVDTARVATASPYSAAHSRHSWLETGAAQGRDSLADVTASADVDSANSSPGVQRHALTPAASLSLSSLRRAACGGEAERREAARRRAGVHRAFRSAPFDQLLAITMPKYELKDKLAEIFASLSPPAPASPPAKPPLYFPELFMH